MAMEDHIKFTHKHEPNTTSFYIAGEEMLKMNTKGFWVRGKKVKQDDKEAEAVYNAFKEFLTWASLSR